MNEEIDAAVLHAIERFSGVAIANAIETFGVRLRNQGFANGSIRCLVPGGSPAVGHAVTARVRCSSPPPVGHQYIDRTDWWSYITSVAAPRFVVVEDIDVQPGLGAFVGDVHANILRALGCVAYATNGSVRDCPAIARIPLPVFGGSIAVSHAFTHIVDFGQPVKIGGLAVETGDILFGDVHGLQSIPRETVERLPAAAADLIAKDQAVIELCRSPKFSIDKLRLLVRDLG